MMLALNMKKKIIIKIDIFNNSFIFHQMLVVYFMHSGQKVSHTHLHYFPMDQPIELALNLHI